MVIDLHGKYPRFSLSPDKSQYDRKSGRGETGNLNRLDYLSQGAVLVAPSGYRKSWNVTDRSEGSKADDVGFILELISKVLKEEPAADEDNVNLIGTSNGAGLIYRMIIGTHADRPFRRWKTSNLESELLV